MYCLRGDVAWETQMHVFHVGIYLLYFMFVYIYWISCSYTSTAEKSNETRPSTTYTVVELFKVDTSYRIVCKQDHTTRREAYIMGGRIAHIWDTIIEVSVENNKEGNLRCNINWVSPFLNQVTITVKHFRAESHSAYPVLNRAAGGSVCRIRENFIFNLFLIWYELKCEISLN